MLSGPTDSADVRVYDAASGEIVRVLQGRTDGVVCLEVKQDRLVTGSFDTSVRMWDLNSGACLRVLNGHVA